MRSHHNADRRLVISVFLVGCAKRKEMEDHNEVDFAN